MSNIHSFQPNWTSLPGETIIDLLDELNMTPSYLASNMHTTTDYINRLIAGEEYIDSSISHKLEKNLGLSSNFWLLREKQYREDLKRILQFQSERWIKALPIKDMIKFGWIKNDTTNLIETCLNYFKVKTIDEWYNKFDISIANVNFRTSSAFTASPGSIATWLHEGIVQSDQIRCESWNPTKFKSNLQLIKSLTRLKNPSDFLPKLKSLCAECGVAVAIVPTPKGCPASGLTKFLNPNKALLLLSFRYLTDDHFWFTFFHEAGHLLLHSDQEIHVEEISKEKTESIIEDEANEFAMEQLIPDGLKASLLKVAVSNKKSVISFAMKAGISPGIVIGQLQHLGKIDFSKFNSYKRRYTWDGILE